MDEHGDGQAGGIRRESLNELTGKIIGGAFEVSNALGCGFLEKVYENALAHELRKRGLRVERQRPIPVHYDGHLVGDFVADLVVEGLVIVELKAVKEHHDLFAAQCLNYLKATGLPICLLLNFGHRRLDVKRFRGT